MFYVFMCFENKPVDKALRMDEMGRTLIFIFLPTCPLYVMPRY